MESIVAVMIGIICIAIGIANRKGNISMLHSYHRKRVSEEDRLPFGKLVGLGAMIIGTAIILAGGFSFLAEYLQESLYEIMAEIIVGVGLALGLGISFYAMIKYNKGIF